MAYDTLCCEVADGVATIALDQPQARDALSNELLLLVKAFFERREPQWTGR
jgi:enoyl-CoA hydratase/carnithine racemase